MIIVRACWLWPHVQRQAACAADLINHKRRNRHDAGIASQHHKLTVKSVVGLGPPDQIIARQGAVIGFWTMLIGTVVSLSLLARHEMALTGVVATLIATFGGLLIVPVADHFNAIALEAQADD